MYIAAIIMIIMYMFFESLGRSFNLIWCYLFPIWLWGKIYLFGWLFRYLAICGSGRFVGHERGSRTKATTRRIRSRSESTSKKFSLDSSLVYAKLRDGNCGYLWRAHGNCSVVYQWDWASGCQGSSFKLPSSIMGPHHGIRHANPAQIYPADRLG